MVNMRNYTKGKYIVREQLAYADKIKEFIVSEDFLNFQNKRYSGGKAGRKRNSLYVFEFTAANKRLYMKVFGDSKRYDWRRRLELLVRQTFNDYAAASYFGSLAIEGTEIPTHTAVACWTHKESRLATRRYFLYEEIIADFTIRQYRQQLPEAPTLEQRKTLAMMLTRMLCLTKQLHEAGYRHADIHTGNFLVTLPVGADAKQIRPPDIEAAEMYLFDTDHVHKARLKFWPVKQFFDMRCLRRLDFDNDRCQALVKQYLDDNYSEIWWKVWLFWANGGFKPTAWRKRRKRRQKA